MRRWSVLLLALLCGCAADETTITSIEKDGISIRAKGTTQAIELFPFQHLDCDWFVVAKGDHVPIGIVHNPQCKRCEKANR